jgi:hypothetical protein
MYAVCQKFGSGELGDVEVSEPERATGIRVLASFGGPQKTPRELLEFRALGLSRISSILTSYSYACTSTLAHYTKTLPIALHASLPQRTQQGPLRTLHAMRYLQER